MSCVMSFAGHQLPIEIVPYRSFRSDALTRVDLAIDEIFFRASSVQTFVDEVHRDAFRWFWLGRYLIEEPDEAFVAISSGTGGDKVVCGYIVGSLADPATRTEFDDLGYFRTFASATAKYPAHLHVNVASGMRSHGVGARLVQTFAGHAATCGVSGVHIVTGAGMRNVRFYERLGFTKVGVAPHKGGEVVMLGRMLTTPGVPDR